MALSVKPRVSSINTTLHTQLGHYAGEMGILEVIQNPGKPWTDGHEDKVQARLSTKMSHANVCI
jgi:hypothetical protein